MPSFRDKLEQKMESHAYIMGSRAYQSGYPPSCSPYSLDSDAGKEWLDGYFDAWFLITGVQHEF